MDRRSYTRKRDLVSLSGWLFADLMLALAMLFFATSVITKPTPLLECSCICSSTTSSSAGVAPDSIVISIDHNGFRRLAGGDQERGCTGTRTARNAYRKRSAGGSLPTEARRALAQGPTSLLPLPRKLQCIRGNSQTGLCLRLVSSSQSALLTLCSINQVTLDIYLFAQ